MSSRGLAEAISRAPKRSAPIQRKESITRRRRREALVEALPPPDEVEEVEEAEHPPADIGFEARFDLDDDIQSDYEHVMSEPEDMAPLEGRDIWTPQLDDQNREMAELEAEVEIEAEVEAEAEVEVEVEVGAEVEVEVEVGAVPCIGDKVAWESPKSRHPISAFLLAFAVWCDRINVSRADYSAFYEVVKLSRDIPGAWEELSTKLDTLQHIYQSHLPAPSIYEREVNLRLDKMPTGHSGVGKAYFFDQIHLTETILRSTATRHMHFGMAELVDQPSELWHGEAWAESIRACSGQFALYPDGKPVFPSDVVLYRMPDTGGMIHIGRIRSAYRDLRQAPTLQTSAPIILYIDQLNRCVELAPDIQGLVGPYFQSECFLIEGLPPRLISANQIVSRYQDISFDRDYRDSREIAEEAELRSTQEAARIRIAEARREARIRAGKRVNQARNRGMPPPPSPISPGTVYQAFITVRRIINIPNRTIRPVRLSHPIRGELEIDIYGRDVLEKQFVSREGAKPIKSMPQMTFIDGFGLYRNMYRSLTGIYMIPSNLPLRERSRLVNVFPLTLGPHGSQLVDVLGCLEASSQALERGLTMLIPDESGTLIETFVCSPTLGYLGDMPQQNDCAGFMRHTALYGCRSCRIPKAMYGNLDYDISTYGRYHHETLNIRAQTAGMPPSVQKNHLNSMGISVPPPPVLKLSPALDICRGFPIDPPHAEMAGISRLLQDLLIQNLLLPAQRDLYGDTFRKLNLPPGWGRIQNPIRHRASWDLSEQTRACVLTPVLLRNWLTNQRLHPTLVRSIELEFSTDISTEPRLRGCDIVTRVFGQLAWSYSLITAHMGCSEEEVIESIIQVRRSFQKLVRCAISAIQPNRGVGGIGRRHSRASSIMSDISAVSAASNPMDEDEAAPRGANQEANKDLEKWISRPNIHVGLHYSVYLRQYGTLWNTNVLIGEQYHKLFKRQATKTNHRSVDLQLLRHEGRKKASRFTMEGAFADSNPEISRAFTSLQISCPTLVEHLLPASSHQYLEDDTELGLESTPNHLNPRAQNRIPAHYIRRGALPTKPRASTDFDDMLRDAYYRDYNRKVHELGFKNYVYYQRFTSVDVEAQKRIGYTAGTYILLERGSELLIGRIEHIFTHQLNQIIRLFILVQIYDDTGNLDHISRLPMIRKTPQKAIYGISAVPSKRLYIIPIEGSDSLLLWCTWAEVSFC